MAYKIIWSPKAEERFDEIVAYLQESWTDKEIAKFIERVEDVITAISENPEIYRKSEKKNIYEAIVTKHNILLYRIEKKQVILLTFFDTRRKPSKKYK